MVRDTSLICFRELVELGKVSERCQEVYKYIRDHPDETDTEIAYGLGYVDPNKVRPRRKDLFNMGLVVEAGKRPCVHSDKVCYTWEAVDRVARKQFFDKKEVFREDGYVERVFKSKTLTEVVILVHNWLNKYSAKKFDAKIFDGAYESGVNVIICVRNNV